jgi:RHS repeat-associated protein
VTTFYVRSSVLGGQVIAELGASGNWAKGYVYLGGQMLAIQNGSVNWVHQDPVTKSQRITNSSGTVVSTIDLDPWGGETNRSANSAFQPHKYTTYERDGNGGDDAMMRRYQSNWTRFSQPDPSDGSYDATNPQSFNRYAYVQNDPVNFTDPSGLNLEDPNGSSRPQPLTGNGIFSPGIHFYTFYTQTSSLIDGVRQLYPERGPYTGIFVVGGVGGGGGQQDAGGTPLTSGEVNTLLGDLQNLLSNPDCAGFIKSALEQLKTDTGRSQHGTTDILKLFDAVKTGKGFDYRTMKDAQARGGGGPGYASISIDPNLAWSRMSSAARGVVLIHELFHVAGYGHEAMAKATRNMGERFDESWKPWRGQFPDPSDSFFRGPNGNNELEGSYSGFFNNVLRQNCK